MRRDQRYRYLINDNPQRLEVHDLDNEQTGPFECQIDEIQNYRYLVSTNESGLRSWLNENSQYDGCAYCLPNLHWK
jgi:hypothetical protein